MSFLNDVIFSNVQANATVLGPAIDASFLRSCSVISTTGTGTATGTVTVQVSNDQLLPGNKPTNWILLPTATVNVVGPGVVVIPKIDLCYQWVRVVYTDGSTGTGSSLITTVLHAQTG